LRPWFHKMVQDDFGLATSKLRELALVIAQWPGQWWIRDHVEIWELIPLMVQTLGEEVREKQKYEVGQEVKSLQSLIEGLERLVRQYESQIGFNARERKISSSSKALHLFTFPKRISHKRSDTDTTLVDLLETKVVESAPEVLKPASGVRWHLMAETVSCVCTGLLFGAFITMCIVNSQRRTLILNLT